MRRPSMLRITLLSLLCTCAAVASASDALERGFAAGKVYDFGGIDAVNTFNGNLSLNIPLGPKYPVNGATSYGFTLSYNSKVWDYEKVKLNSRAVPNRRSNAGVGWLLSFGKVIGPADPTNPDALHWVYEGPDGSIHKFSSALHPGDPATSFAAPVTAVEYSTDSTYLRMLRKNDGTVDIEFPDGEVHTFNATTGKLARVRDRFTNAVYIAYSAAVAGTPCPSTDNYVWTITDSKAARTNYVCFKNEPYPESTYEGQIDRIIIAAPTSSTGVVRTATYQFVYAQTALRRGCHSSVPDDPTDVAAPLLTSILQPDGTSYGFRYNATHAGHCESGTLKQVTLPTLGVIDYAYRYYEVPYSECGNNNLMNTYLTGVETKTVSGPRIPAATWRYQSLLSTTPAQIQCETGPGALVWKNAPAEQMTVTVTDPAGNRTEHYYSVWPSNMQISSPNGFRVEDYGLPLSKLASSTLPSAAVTSIANRTWSSAGTLLRSTFLKYEQDAKSTFCGNTEQCEKPVNPRVSASRTVYHDDAGSTADVESSDFDGLGHYRRRKETGTGSLAAGSRETFTAYNTRDPEVNPSTGISSGTYTTAGTFTPPSAAASWIIDSASHVQTTEGTSIAKAQSCYDGTTGFLRALRIMKGTARDTADTVVVHTPDANGNMVVETWFGADVKRNASTISPLCSVATTTLPAYDYRITHGYQWGVRNSSTYTGASFSHLNLTIDRYTGFPTLSTDTAGLASRYAYDAAFRVTAVTHPALAGTGYAYANATASTPASVLAKQGTQQNQYQYDGLGRVWREKTLMPDNAWSVGETTYDAAGRVSATAAPEKLVVTTTEYNFVPSRWTTFDGHDPFGRPSTITTPDGKATTKSYAGVSSSTVTVLINGATGEAPVTSREAYDRQGRLIAMTDAFGTAGAQTTQYGYDVGGRLKSVSMPGTAGTQARLFSYDNRGYLLSEQQPELGASGNGTKTYLDYDARGHARRQYTGAMNGAFDLTYALDQAERVTSVQLTSTGQFLKELDYDDPDGLLYPHCAGNRCNGRLAAAARYHQSSDLGGLIAVTASYQYDDGGRVSRVDNSVGSTALFTGDSFNTARTFSTLGKIESLYYPCRTDPVAGCNPIDQAQRRMAYRYTNGFMTSFLPAASAIAYAPDGTVSNITHGSGTTAVQETIATDSGMARPCGIFVYGPGVTLTADGTAPCGKRLSGTGAQWSSGAYAYDGGGNIKQIAGNSYRYDAFNRLSSWSTALGTTSRTYDSFGNYVATGYAVSGTTNRYTTMGYDAAGNVTSDSTGTYSYDALGMMTAANVGSRQFRYLYLPNDERIAAVERVVIGGVVRTNTTWTLRGAGPELLRVYSDETSSGTRAVSWKEDVFWRGGKLLGTETPGGTRHYGLDHLGSPRIITDANGALLGTQDFTPFGNGGSSNGGSLQFTGQERDAASVGGGAVDLADYFHARYYRPDAGRFLSMDPADDVDPTRPQSWNQYSYVQNDPVNATDPSGMFIARWYGETTVVAQTIVFSTWKWLLAGRVVSQQLDRWNTRWSESAREDRMALSLRMANAFGTRYSTYEECAAVYACDEDFEKYLGFVGGVGRAGTLLRAGKITGYTKHGLNQAISRGGRGVSVAAIRDTVTNPVAVKAMANGTTRYTGKTAVVILNRDGKVVTTWAKTSSAWRTQP
jgi:RHS repeat-associated protein